MNRLNLIGQIFGLLVVLEFVGSKKYRTMWLCKCECGNKCIVAGYSLKEGNTKSCGCLNTEKRSKLGKSHIRHGMKKTHFWRIWRSMRNRCFNINYDDYKYYGGRGITICDKWVELFENFRDDMYENYLKHLEEFGEKNTSLDRIDVNGNYEPSNCKWSTNIEQANNTSISIKSNNPSEHRKWRKLLASCLSKYLKRQSNSKLFYSRFGAECSDVILYLESLWVEGMSWDNYGIGKDKWNIDHIVGCNNFDLSKEQDRLDCFHYKNLRPLWVTDHIKKSITRINKGGRN